MKKIIALLLVLAMALSLVACGGAKEEPKAEAPAAPAEGEAAAVVEPTNEPDTIVVMAPPRHRRVPEQPEGLGC